MQFYLTPRRPRGAVPLTPLTKAELAPWLGAQPARIAAWVGAAGFTAGAGATCPIPDEAGGLGRVLIGLPEGDGDGPWPYGGLPMALPAGAVYWLDAALPRDAATQAALGWALGAYGFDRYRKKERALARLVWPKGADRAAVERAARATYLVRDLINTPAQDMGPAEVAGAARRLARQYTARLSVVVGEALARRNYPAIHAVGRASARAPRLIDLRWGARGPRIALVGKGVCFDTGGLDLKSAAGMKLMKKDMGGAAHVLALAGMIMAARLPVRLRVLIPAVENSVAGNALRPLDVIATRKGLSVEVGNTDAEGRLVLADALAEADREDPALILDFATLTGAARVALGTELPAMFCNHDSTAKALLAHGRAAHDPLWRMPLHAPYRPLLDSKVADLNNISGGAYGGAIMAALFLAEFVRASTPWVHCDIMGWNVRARPGRPEGGEAMGLRAAYGLIEALTTRAGRGRRP